MKDQIEDLLNPGGSTKEDTQDGERAKTDLMETPPDIKHWSEMKR